MKVVTGETTLGQTSFWHTAGSAALKSQPAKEATVTHTRLNEHVKVYALYKETDDRRFPHDKLRPMMFIWRNQEYRVQDVTYVWRENRGESEVYHFTVSDGANVFELCYNARSFDWTLSGVYAE
jgi:hypothetical protein